MLLISRCKDEMVQELDSMIAELQRITVLWEERWFDGLSHRQNDVMRRMQQLKGEAKRLNEVPLCNSAAEFRPLLTVVCRTNLWA